MEPRSLAESLHFFNECTFGLIAFLTISDQYATLFFPIFFTKWPLAAILDDRKSLSIAFHAISDQYATFFSLKWPPAAIFGSLIWAILDDRKSLSIAFLTISDQYATFLLIFADGGHFGSLICAKKHKVLHYVLSMAVPNMKLIGDFMTKLCRRHKLRAFLYKMAARGHFIFPIDAKNHRVLVIWDLNGYGEYEFDWCICDKVMACTSVGVRRRRWWRNQKHHFGDMIILDLSLTVASFILQGYVIGITKTVAYCMKVIIIIIIYVLYLTFILLVLFSSKPSPRGSQI